MNNLDHIFNSNLKDINQFNVTIEHEIKFNSTSDLSICPNKYPLIVLTVILGGFKMYRISVVYLLICL